MKKKENLSKKESRNEKEENEEKNYHETKMRHKKKLHRQTGKEVRELSLREGEEFLKESNTEQEKSQNCWVKQICAKEQKRRNFW